MSVRAVASAHSFVAGPEFVPVASVSRCSASVLTVTSVAALMVVVPVAVDVMTAVQDPVPPAVVQLLAPTNAAVAPPAFVSEKLIMVPFGALTKPAPALMLTCAVSVWFVPTGLLSVAGLIEMFASPVGGGGGGGGGGGVVGTVSSSVSGGV